ncbi:hypothetical protein Srufu_019870 [Streptomyces libani subsp. rufus]|nr:hypothetical protein Srufu_019870 [Streptomyces libani subsp. rufus]
MFHCLVGIHLDHRATNTVAVLKSLPNRDSRSAGKSVPAALMPAPGDDGERGICAFMTMDGSVQGRVGRTGGQGATAG